MSVELSLRRVVFLCGGPVWPKIKGSSWLLENLDRGTRLTLRVATCFEQLRCKET